MDRLKDSLTAQAGLLGELMTSVLQPLLADLHISVATFELLSAVKAGGGSLPQAELARRLGVSPPTLCEAVGSAAKRGLLEQKPHPHDARAKTLSLTKKGSKVVSDVVERMNQAEGQMVHGIGDHELSAALDVLRRVNRNLAKTLNDTRS
jgi:DNA-binding MarR family transcriptional regulator